MEPFKLPRSLLLGAATSAFQVEGGETNHSWYRWSREPGRIRDGTDCSVACDHWNRFAEDTALMKKLGLETYRLGIEWSRIEPREGHFDDKSIMHYRKEIEGLKKAGIAPLITLHHFSNPLWMEDSGSWLKKTAVKRFERYTSFVTDALGDIVSDWLTINEPNVYLYLSFVEGTFPPGRKSFAAYIRGARVMIDAHMASYEAIHGIRRRMGHRDTMVGAAHHIRVFDTARGSTPEKLISWTRDRLFHEVFLRGMSSGEIILPFGMRDSPGTADYQDYIGLNYYTRDIISFSLRSMKAAAGIPEGAPVNDLGWEIYPEGLYRICKNLHARFGKPIFITENGTCDFKDSFRQKYLLDHLFQVKRLIDEGVNVARYYHWSLMDNFELAEGLRYRFGLIHVDFDTQKRTIKKSGRLYGDIIRKRAVTREMIRGAG